MERFSEPALTAFAPTPYSLNLFRSPSWLAVVVGLSCAKKTQTSWGLHMNSTAMWLWLARGYGMSKGKGKSDVQGVPEASVGSIFSLYSLEALIDNQIRMVDGSVGYLNWCWMRFVLFSLA